MQAVILAGGLGSRLRPFTEVIPKPLLPLGEKSILEIQAHALRAAGVTDVYLATNYMADFIEAYVGNGSRFGVNVHISREDRPLGTAGPLALLADRLQEPFLVMNGDIITQLDFRKFHDWSIESGRVLTVATKAIVTPFRFGNVTANEDDCIIGVEEKPNLTLEVVAGIYCMTPEIFEHIPKGEYFGMDTLIKDLLACGEAIGRYRIHEYWLDIGQVDDYSTARREYSTHFEAQPSAASPVG